MKDKNHEQIVFEMLEEVATESIAEARNDYTYDKTIRHKKTPTEAGV